MFLTTKPARTQALDLAETDVLAAFDTFLATRPRGDRPFILAGHSQGALHLVQLLKKRVSGTPLAARMIAFYVIGWPVSIEHDLPALPDIPPCRSQDAMGCIISWQTFGVKADTKTVREDFDRQIGLDGRVSAGSRMLCTNPLTWTSAEAPAPPSAHLGGLPIRQGWKAAAPDSVDVSRCYLRCGRSASSFLLTQRSVA